MAVTPSLAICLTVDYARRMEPSSKGPGTPRGAAPIVLVVDDDDYVHQTLTAALRGVKATIIRASTAAEGLALAHDRRPELAIVDVGLPDEDGYSLTRRLRADESLAGLSILILTGHLPDEPAAREAGANGIIGKPFRLHELVDAVTAQLGGST
jgi:DNA-binding response OmpR family regulator